MGDPAGNDVISRHVPDRAKKRPQVLGDKTWIGYRLNDGRNSMPLDAISYDHVLDCSLLLHPACFSDFLLLRCNSAVFFVYFLFHRAVFSGPSETVCHLLMEIYRLTGACAWNAFSAVIREEAGTRACRK